MLNLESQPITVLDIGAHGGASAEWSTIGTFVDLIGFEPDKNEAKRLDDRVSQQSFVRSERYRGTINQDLLNLYRFTSIYKGL